MFQDDFIAGSWPDLLARLERSGAVQRWAAHEPALAAFDNPAAVADRIDRRVYGPAGDEIVAALLRRARVGDEDELLFLLHCLSGVALGLVRDLHDLHDDITSVVVGELTFQISRFPIERRQRAVAESLRLETRRAVLAELKPSIRNHPEMGERLTSDGRVGDLAARLSRNLSSADDIDLADLLGFAVEAGIDQANLQLVLDMEIARAAVAGIWQRSARRADHNVAVAYGVCDRTLYRRRRRTLNELQTVARDYLAAVA